MKVCAHFNVTPFQHFHRRFGSIYEARRYFEDCLRELDPQPNVYGDLPTMDVALQCDDCNDVMLVEFFESWLSHFGPARNVSGPPTSS